jgi:hypothetical protein
MMSIYCRKRKSSDASGKGSRKNGKKLRRQLEKLK